MDCETYGSCSGGYIINSLMYIRDTGLTTEPNYPYVAKKNTCLNTSTFQKFKITGYDKITSNSVL